jgi:hypothetical protein
MEQGSIQLEYGLESLGSAPTPALFWNSIRSRLVSRLDDYAATYAGTLPLEIVLIAGEAADNLEFLEVAREVVAAIPSKLLSTTTGELVDGVATNQPVASKDGETLW